METYKLKVKVGESEFEAEGPEEAVKAQFEAFKQMLESGAVKVTAPHERRGEHPPKNHEVGNEALLKLYKIEERNGRKDVTLRFTPQGGERRVSTALLLLLHGHRELADVENVPVTTLSDAMEQSGVPVARLDRAAAPLLREGLALRGGRSKGTWYRLTNQGTARAQDDARTLLEQI